jgi:tetratricopeptide (TPR) repeat protein
MITRLTCIIAAALLLFAVPARAEDDKKAEAEKYFRAGEALYKNGQYLGAAQAFEEAFELLPLPAIAFSTAQAYRLLYVSDKEPAYVKRAVELYRLYIQQQKEGGRVPDATASLAELEPVLDRIEQSGKSTAMPIEAPKTQLMISSQVDGATGEIAGQKGTLPLIVEVEKGDYTAHVEAPGYFPTDVKATAVEGQFIVTEVELQPKPGVIDIKAESGARVEIDGRPFGSTPLARPIEVPAGQHYVSITRRGRHSWSENVTAKRGETVKLDISLRSTSQRNAVPFVWLGAGILAVAAGGAGAYALVEQGKAEDLDAKRQTDSITTDELNQYLTYRDHRDAAVKTMWGLAGASVVTATIGMLMYLFDRPMAEAPPPTFGPAEETGTSVSPFATAGGAGVEVGGVW